METNRTKDLFNRRSKSMVPPIPTNLKTPRALDLTTFVEARTLELEKFLTNLKDKLDGKFGNKLVTQLLPKAIRRRAMSHNAYLIPWRVRRRIKNPITLTKGEKPNETYCRKKRRNAAEL
jgi:ribonuclease P/MRP protein subunit POP1